MGYLFQTSGSATLKIIWHQKWAPRLLRRVSPLRPPNRRDLRSPAPRRRNPLPLTINFELVLNTNGVFRSHLQIATVLTPLLSPQPLQCEPTPRRIPPSPQHPSAGTCLLLTARLKAKTSLTKTQENCRSGFCGEKNGEAPYFVLRN